MGHGRRQFRHVAAVCGCLIAAAVASAWWNDEPLDHANGWRPLDEFEGRPQSYAVERLGRPVRTFEFRLGDAAGEQLRDPETVTSDPPRPPVPRDAWVRELTWERAKVHVTVWYLLDGGIDPLAVRAMQWSKGMWPHLLEPPPAPQPPPLWPTR